MFRKFTTNSTDFMNFFGIVFEQAVEKGIKIHNHCKFEGRFKAQFSRNASFRERCSFVREACWSSLQPSIVHAVDIISIEPASSKQFFQPENIQQAPLKSFLHLNHLFETEPFESGLTKLYVLKQCPYTTCANNLTH